MDPKVDDGCTGEDELLFHVAHGYSCLQIRHTAVQVTHVHQDVTRQIRYRGANVEPGPPCKLESDTVPFYLAIVENDFAHQLCAYMRHRIVLRCRTYKVHRR